MCYPRSPLSPQPPSQGVSLVIDGSSKAAQRLRTHTVSQIVKQPLTMHVERFTRHTNTHTNTHTLAHRPIEPRLMGVRWQSDYRLERLFAGGRQHRLLMLFTLANCAKIMPSHNGKSLKWVRGKEHGGQGVVTLCELRTHAGSLSARFYCRSHL